MLNGKRQSANFSTVFKEESVKTWNTGFCYSLKTKGVTTDPLKLQLKSFELKKVQEIVPKYRTLKDSVRGLCLPSSFPFGILGSSRESLKL
jgi:hypothetical protein